MIGPYVYEVVIPDNVTPEQALVELTTPGMHNPQVFSGEWLQTKAGYSIRRDAVTAYAAGTLTARETLAPDLKR